jgi:hypothetical protein
VICVECASFVTRKPILRLISNFDKVLRFIFIAFFLFSILTQGIGQVRLNTLRLGSKEVYELRNTDVMVADTLVLGDSARVILNVLKPDNFIHLKKLVVGRGSAIIGRGIPGIPGAIGLSNTTAGGPCRDGSTGQPGLAGTSGADAINLFLYVDELVIKGSLLIDLAGGDGGDGGKGGRGSDGNAGTRLCQGGNGGDGGEGGPGGNGGQGGNFTINSKYGADLRKIVGDKIIVRSFGGFGGIGGEGGLGGMCGLGPSKDGDQGKKGQAGLTGTAGKPGGVFYVQK